MGPSCSTLLTPPSCASRSIPAALDSPQRRQSCSSPDRTDPSYTSYAVSKDGASFIMVEIDPNARPTQLNVVLNWAEEVKGKK